MQRNRAFQAERKPAVESPYLTTQPSHAAGPISFLNPTRASFHVKNDDFATEYEKSSSNSNTPGVKYQWTSRNNRKGRHALAVGQKVVASHNVPPSSSTTHVIVRGIIRMFTYYPVWDVSYLVATVFTIGSIVWVFNAFFVFLPLVQPATGFSTESLYAGGITAFIGATIFVFGSFLLMAEAVNENRTACFGWAIEQLEEAFRDRRGSKCHIHPSRAACTHHHANKHNLVGTPATPTALEKNAKLTWVWFPSWKELRSHYLYELGFLACLAQLIGASIFWIAGLTALPGIYNRMSPGLTDGIYWAPQVIGGCGFIVSGVLFMIETQPRWYIPAPKVLGWHIGLWNLIGGIGFTLCPCFGYDTESWAQYQAALSTFWASWAFLIGSVVQWYESLDKHPVEHTD